MTSDQWERIKELFDAATELPPGERSSFLSRACSGDDAVRAEVQRLLGKHDQMGEFLERPAVAVAAAQIGESHTFSIDELVSHRFRIVRFIAQGGMGEVYEAEDLELGEPVALKTIRPEIAADPRAIAHFKREIRLSKKVTHPNVCRIFDIARHQKNPHGPGDSAQEVTYLTMELLRGETLAERLSRAGRMTGAEALPIVTQIAEGLEAAHRAGVIHRDLKSSNVALVPLDGDCGFRAVVTDFGLALPAEGSAGGALVGYTGTPAYMAPEQVERGTITRAADIYSLGVVMFEMVTGTLPFFADTPTLIANKRLEQSAPSPRSVVPDLDRRWEQAILRCLERDPRNRFAAAADVGTALHPKPWPRVWRHRESSVLRAGTAFPLVTPPGLGAVRKPLLLRRWLVLTAAALVVIAAAAGTYRNLNQRQVHRLTDKDTIVLADFTNTTGDSIFDGTLRQGLSAQLEQSPFLNLLSDQRIAQTLALMSQPRDARLTRKLAREVCQRTASAATIEGSIASLGSQYLLGLQAVNCHNGDTLAEQRVTANGKGQVLKALGEEATRIRRRLGESLASVEKFDTPPENVTTPSLEALRAYSLGWRAAYVNSDWVAALPFFQQAISLDPNFAMAYARLGSSYFTCGEIGRAAENTRKAYERRARVSEREKSYIDSHYEDLVSSHTADQRSHKAAPERHVGAVRIPADDPRRRLARQRQSLQRR